MGKLLFNVLAMVDEFEADLFSRRTHEGMKVAKAKGVLAELIAISRSTAYRAIELGHSRAAIPARPCELGSRPGRD